MPIENAVTRSGTENAYANDSVRIFLRFGDHDVELSSGDTILGRGPKSTVVLDDPLVSRTHAKLTVAQGQVTQVTIEDLGSANGVIVNGTPVEKRLTLSNGDRIVVGHQTFTLLVQAGSSVRGEPRHYARTLNGARESVPGAARDSIPGDSDRIGPTRRGDALELLGGVADKVLALGRGDEAERILSSYLRNLLQMARGRGEVDILATEKAVMYAVRIAEVTGKGAWVDYAFDMYAVHRRPLPVGIVERLYEIVRKLSPISVSAYRQYLLALRSAESEMGPADRFVVRRIEGLESLFASR